jgi:serine/threonine protein kinase
MYQQGQLIHQRYRIVRKIGQGGMGSVYEAVDERLDKTVALKETIAIDSHVRDAFIAEARLLANLKHPNLPDVSDYFTQNGSQMLVMEYIAGNDLGKLLEQRGAAFSVEKVLAWADTLLEVLDYLHSQQPPVIHRDIKPQNITLTPEERLYLLDFGLAKGQEGTIVTGFTERYAPPEQVQQQSPDARGDLYSLSVTLLHLLTNTAPEGTTTRLAHLAMQQPDTLQPAHVLNPDVPRPISDVLMKGMSIKADDRYANAREMRDALHQARDAAIAAPSIPGATIVLEQPPQTIITSPGAPLPQSDEDNNSSSVGEPPKTIVTPSGVLSPPAEKPSAPPSGENPSKRKAPASTIIIGAVVVVLLLVAAGGGAWAMGMVPGNSDEESTPEVLVTETPQATAEPAPTDAAVAVLPLANQIVFVSDRDGSQDIFVLGADGSDITNLTNGDVEAVAPAISPDGTWIAFVSDEDIFVMNADGSELTNLTSSAADDHSPAWSPDGTRIAFVSDNSIVVMDADGSNPTPITQDTAAYRDLAWSSTGQFAFTLDGDIYQMEGDGSDMDNLTDSSDARDQKPAWSPDGTRIAFSSAPEESSFDIYVMDADGRGVTQLTTDKSIDDAPTWSPDGSQIAFRSGRDRNDEIYVIDSDGGEPANLTENPDADDTNPVWSPE